MERTNEPKKIKSITSGSTFRSSELVGEGNGEMTTIPLSFRHALDAGDEEGDNAGGQHQIKTGAAYNPGGRRIPACMVVFSGPSIIDHHLSLSSP